MCIRDRPYGLQYDPVKHLFPDIVDFAGAGVALVIGADKMILAVVLVSSRIHGHRKCHGSFHSYLDKLKESISAFGYHIVPRWIHR